MFPLFFVFSLLHFFKCRRYVFSLSRNRWRGVSERLCGLRLPRYVDGADKPLGEHSFRLHMPSLQCHDDSSKAFWVDMVAYGCSFLVNNVDFQLGEPFAGMVLESRWMWRIKVVSEAVVSKLLHPKGSFFWNTAGFWPLRDFGVNHLESILQGWLTCRSQRAQHSGSVYGIFIPLALLHLFLRQHLLMRSCRSVAAVTQVGHNGNLTVPWCTSLIHAGIASNC